MSGLPTEADFVPVTTWSRRRRHWAMANTLEPYERGGRTGPMLCLNGDCTDQEATDAERARWPKVNLKAVVIADLPLCKQCEKSKARRIEGRPA